MPALAYRSFFVLILIENPTLLRKMSLAGKKTDADYENYL